MCVYVHPIKNALDFYTVLGAGMGALGANGLYGDLLFHGHPVSCREGWELMSA